MAARPLRNSGPSPSLEIANRRIARLRSETIDLTHLTNAGPNPEDLA